MTKEEAQQLLKEVKETESRFRALTTRLQGVTLRLEELVTARQQAEAILKELNENLANVPSDDVTGLSIELSEDDF